jgi:hypothetical protein
MHRLTVYLRFLSILIVSLVVVSACSKDVSDAVTNKPAMSLEDKLGTQFTAVTKKHFKAPNIQKVSFPNTKDGAAIWGATGRDSEGHIYFGVSTYSDEDRTAYLYQYDPITSLFMQQGDVLSQLKKLSIYKPGMGQSKLHSKFYQADDGYLYFSSFDEQGESSSKGILPTYGGHMWRKKPDALDWEHLFATQEALIAVNTDGRYVYALSYWDHILYQYDTHNGRINNTTVGAMKGHISRNFLVSQSGRVFVPKVEKSIDDNITVNLNEYDSDLNLVDSHPLEHYVNNKDSKHGIVSYINMKNGDMYFVTAVGALYKISQTNNSHQVSFEIFLSETNEVGGYFPSLFSINGENFLVALGRLANSKYYSWFVYETSTKTTAIYDLKTFDNKNLLYGSVTRDDLGNFYVVGVDQSIKSKHQPIILQLSY